MIACNDGDAATDSPGQGTAHRIYSRLQYRTKPFENRESDLHLRCKAGSAVQFSLRQEVARGRQRQRVAQPEPRRRNRRSRPDRAYRTKSAAVSVFKPVS